MNGGRGGVRSILNGPRCTAPDQLPAASRERRWNQDVPSGVGVRTALLATASTVSSGTLLATASKSHEYPATPESASMPVHETWIESSPESTSTAGVGSLKIAFPGGVASIQKGPRCTVAAASEGFPAPSTVRRWNQCAVPSGKGALTVFVDVVSTTASGTVVESMFHTYEYPAMPLPVRMMRGKPAAIPAS